MGGTGAWVAHSKVNIRRRDTDIPLHCEDSTKLAAIMSKYFLELPWGMDDSLVAMKELMPRLLKHG